MREANNEIGVGIVFCIVTLMSVICIFALARVGAFSSVAEDCQKLGAFYIAGTVYECKEKKIDK